MKLYSIAFHNMRRKKAKALGILFVLTLAVTLTVALTVLARTTEQELQNSFDKIGSNMVIVPKEQDLTLNYNGVTVPGVSLAVQELEEKNLALIKTIKNKESIANVAPKLIGMSKVGDKPALIVGTNLSSELAMKAWWNFQDGKSARTLVKLVGVNDVVVGSDAAKRLGLKTGDTVSLGRNRFVVKGILQNLGSEEDNVVFLDLHKAQEILNKPGKVSFVELAALCYTCPIDEIVKQISAVLPDAKVSALRQSLDLRKQTVERFAQTARAVAGAILLLGVLITANAIMGTINERTREIGVFRAIGFRKTHIAKIILTEELILAIMAALLGGLIGGAGAIIIAPIIMDLPLKVSFVPMDALLALAVSVGTALLAAVYPLIKAMRLNPADALRML